MFVDTEDPTCTLCPPNAFEKEASNASAPAISHVTSTRPEPYPDLFGSEEEEVEEIPVCNVTSSKGEGVSQQQVPLSQQDTHNRSQEHLAAEDRRLGKRPAPQTPLPYGVEPPENGKKCSKREKGVASSSGLLEITKQC